MGWVEAHNDQSPFEWEASVLSRRAEPQVIHSLPTWQGKQQKNNSLHFSLKSCHRSTELKTWAFNNELQFENGTKFWPRANSFPWRGRQLERKEQPLSLPCATRPSCSPVVAKTEPRCPPLGCPALGQSQGRAVNHRSPVSMAAFGGPKGMARMTVHSGPAQTRACQPGHLARAPLAQTRSCFVPTPAAFPFDCNYPWFWQYVS